MKHTPLPEALKAIPSEVLENYVGSQIAMFANGLAHRLSQHGYTFPTDVYKESAREVFQLLISDPSPRKSLGRAPDMQLVFRHDCLALGCLVASCKLCKHNPSRRCAVNFDKKYLVNDVLKAKCQAVIRVEIVERVTNMPVDGYALRDDIILQMAILDGNTYDAKFEAGLENDFETCLLLMNNKNSPTLVGLAVGNDQHGFIRLPFQGNRTVLPDLRVTDSSEAMLSGRKPPLRLMTRAVFKDTLQPVPHIRHAISEGFVVATRRTRTAGKVEIPSVDDHVSKLEHMGRETVKKLVDLSEAAAQAGIDDMKLPCILQQPSCIETVGDFQKLALAAEQDGHLQKRLQQVLKLNREKWEEAREHALKAVVIDNRMRVWWAGHPNSLSGQLQVGMVFVCTRGIVDLETPIALLQDGGELCFASEWNHTQHQLVSQLQPVALSQWWQPGHANWALLPWDSEAYKTSGELRKARMADSENGTERTSGNADASRLNSLVDPKISDRVSSDAPVQFTSRARADSSARPPIGQGLRGGRLKAEPAPTTGGALSAASLLSNGGQLRNEDNVVLQPFAGTSLQELQGAGARVMSGVSMEGLNAEPNGHPLTISRNTSGLDTMQSIEQALPDGEQ